MPATKNPNETFRTGVTHGVTWMTGSPIPNQQQHHLYRKDPLDRAGFDQTPVIGGNTPTTGGPGPVPGGGGGGGAGGTQSSVMAEYRKAFDSAKAANEARYNQILSEYRNRYTRNLALLQGMGTQERMDIDQQFQGLSSRAGQDMVSRGLTGTTIAPTVQAGIARERAGAQGRLNERLRREQVDVDSRLSGDTLGFMERRNDEYPDPNLYMRLMEIEARTSPGPQGSSLMPSAQQNGLLYSGAVQNGLLYSGAALRASPVTGASYGGVVPRPARATPVIYNGVRYASMADAQRARATTRQNRAAKRAAKKARK